MADNPFIKPVVRATPQDFDMTPGAPYWWLDRLSRILFDRQERYNELENYMLGDHPLPNGDVRYVKALRELQQKARTNYVSLVVKAVTGRMRVVGFRFGPDGEANDEAMKIWNASNMDLQSPMNLNTAAVFGLTYGLVAPPEELGGEPTITIEDPRMCVIERDPLNFSRGLAGLKLYRDNVHDLIVACLYLPEMIFVFAAPDAKVLTEPREARISTDSSLQLHASRFELVSAEPNELGEVPLIEGNWQPAFGPLGRSEFEDVLDIQDRINYQVLTHLVISKSQAYRQRWATGLKPVTGPNGQKAAPFDPGADMVWTSADKDVQFGDFAQADIRQALEAVRDSVDQMAAITQTPASYLMNKMVNVSGQAIIGDQAPLVQKIKMRMSAMGWFYEKLLKLAFAYKGEQDKATNVDATTLWADPELRSQAEMADALQKLVASEVPLEIAMARAGFSPAETAYAVKKQEEAQRKQEELAMKVAAGTASPAELPQRKPGAMPGNGQKTMPGASKAPPPGEANKTK